jgi:hypothetical protein
MNDIEPTRERSPIHRFVHRVFIGDVSKGSCAGSAGVAKAFDRSFGSVLVHVYDLNVSSFGGERKRHRSPYTCSASSNQHAGVAKTGAHQDRLSVRSIANAAASNSITIGWTNRPTCTVVRTGIGLVAITAR